MKNNWPIAVIYIGFISLLFLIFSLNSIQKPYIVFVDDSCESCEILSDNIELLKFEERLYIHFVDVIANQSNKDLYFELLTRCGYPEGSPIVTPLLYFEDQCIIGTRDILIKLEEEVVIKN